MLKTILLLSSFGFAFIYPLCFWISSSDPLKNNFHHFHTALPCVVGGVITGHILLGHYPDVIKFQVVFWCIALLAVTAFYWGRDTCSPFALTVSTLIGLYVFYRIQEHFLTGQASVLMINILSSLIFCASLFAMNLGHWYLNVHGLPIGHLRRAVHVLWFLVLVRGFWDGFHLATQQITWAGEPMALYRFLGTIDGLFLFIGLFFGILLPFGALILVREILRLKNTQAATGILYVVLCSVIIGDLTFKYYLINFGVVL